MPQNIKIRYDPRFDMLYIKWGSTKGCYGDDSEPGLIYARDSKPGEIKGVTLVHFVKRYREHCLPSLDQQISLDYRELYRAVNPLPSGAGT